MNDVEIKRVPAEATRPLRHQILRPTQDPKETVFPGDDHTNSFHAAAFVAGKMVGISSIYPQDLKEVFDTGPWRIRGMAVLSDYRGLNIGRLLLETCLEHAKKEKGSFAWCNARVRAADFYFKLGFKQLGEAFEIPDIGLHFVLRRELSP